MGYVILGLVIVTLVVAAVYLVAWLATAAFLLYIAPGLMILVPASLLAGAGMAVVVVLGTLAGRGSLRPATVTPAQVEEGTAPLPAPRGERPEPRDRAWPSYLSAQRRVDLPAAWAQTTRMLGMGWRWIGKALADDGLTPLRFVVLPFVIVTWLVVSVGALVTAAGLLTLCHLVLFVEWVAWIALVGSLRGIDRSVRRLRQAEASCPACYHVAPRPCYACSGCGRIHRDVRPGRLGAVWRRCDCDAVLPTTVLRASFALKPKCARCGEELRRHAGAITDVRIPVFGPVSAGKTRLVYAGLLAIKDAVAAGGGRFDFVDDESEKSFSQGSEVVDSDSNTEKTDAGLMKPAITTQLTLSRRRRGLLHLFDAAGEDFVNRDANTELEFLDHAVGLVLVVDPFSIRSVRDQVGSAGQASLALAGAAIQDPEIVYQTTSRRLRDYQVDTANRWLAVAVVKADLLAGLPPAEGLRPGHVRQWLIDAGLDNLVLSAERDFGKVRYFVVASIAERRAGVAMSPANPFDWLLSRRGLGIRPSQTEEAGAPNAGSEEQRHEPASV